MKLIAGRGWIYPVTIALAVLGFLVWWLGRYEVSVQVETAPPELPRQEIAPLPLPQAPEHSPQPTRTEQAAQPLPRVANSQQEGAIAPSGELRVSNPTNFPVRVALLRQAKGATGKTAFDEPIHWDFAPQEGGTAGLVLAMPDGNVRLQAGDVLVAFAQDGSRRYWGPFVVGQTAEPTWNAQEQEWQLVLR